LLANRKKEGKKKDSSRVVIFYERCENCFSINITWVFFHRIFGRWNEFQDVTTDVSIVFLEIVLIGFGCNRVLFVCPQIIAPYIDKEVNYVVTDFPGYNGKATRLAETSATSIISPQCYSVSPATSVSGDDPSAAKKSVSIERWTCGTCPRY
jgi:hypothetical protein